jgi:hypothetical protein
MSEENTTPDVVATPVEEVTTPAEVVVEPTVDVAPAEETPAAA